MDMQCIITKAPPDHNPITLLMLCKLRASGSIPDNALVDELFCYLVDEQKNYLTDKE